jgi:hypothetical protein
MSGSERGIGTLAEARRRRGNLELRTGDCVSAYALRGSSVIGCGFLQIRAICGNRDICVANDASSQPEWRKLACPCPTGVAQRVGGCPSCLSFQNSASGGRRPTLPPFSPCFCGFARLYEPFIFAERWPELASREGDFETDESATLLASESGSETPAWLPKLSPELCG